MRLSYGQRRGSRRGQRHGAFLTTIAAVLPTLTAAAQLQRAPPANLDFSDLGSVGIAGDFDGISLYDYVGQSGSTRTANGSQALLSSLPNGALSRSAQTDASIRTVCLFNSTSSKTKGVVVGGNFTSFGGSQSKAIGLYDVAAAKVVTIDGLEGEVNAVLCDEDAGTVYIGGNFKSGNSTNAITWDGSQFKNLPFTGFNGPVNAITKMSNGHILFGGSFTGLGNLNTSMSRQDTQIINLGSGMITADGSTSRDGFSDPANIVCSSGADTAGSTWLLQDGTPGFWDAEFGFTFAPTTIRIWNTHIEGRGTKSFNLKTFPAGLDNILNMTYVDQATGKDAFCDRLCPLSDDPKVKYQDFHFVNPISMKKLRIDIVEWYGSGGGLAGVQIFQQDIISYAANKFNQPKCRTGDSEPISSSDAVGPWLISPAQTGKAEYLTARLNVQDNPENASVTFYPNVPRPGNYSINLYTPGCIADGSCANRGRVYVSGTMSRNTRQPDFETQLFQTNNYDKYDQIFFGFVDRTSDDFKPSVTLRPTKDQTVEELIVVAQQIGFTLINSVGGLNGLYDYDPKGRAADEKNLDSSLLNRLGYSFDKTSGVKSLLTTGETTYIAGNFTSNDHKNIMAVSNKADEAENLDGGLNGQVLGMFFDNNKLYAGGIFSNTLANNSTGLNNAAVYDPDTKTWSPLGGGLDGPVEYVVPIRVNTTKNKPETIIAFSGSFNKALGYGSVPESDAQGFAAWVPSQNIWLHNSPNDVPGFTGTLSTSYLDASGENYLLAGNLDVSTLAVSGVASLTATGLGRFPAKISSKAPSASKRRRSILQGGDVSGVVTGTFYDGGGQELTILAGHFTAEASDNGTLIHNLVFIDANKKNLTTGLKSGIQDDSTFHAVDIWNNVLFAGGQVAGKVDGNDVNGIIGWDLNAKEYAHQPAGLTGRDGVVSAIAVRAKHNQVFVGGSFEKAGALDCPGLCSYSTDNDQWTRPGTVVTGTVTALQWVSDDIILAAGDLDANKKGAKPMAYYNAEKQTWYDFPGADQLPGPVDVLAAASSDLKQFWVGGKSLEDGSVFLMKYDGTDWQTVKQKLPDSTVLRSVQMFSLTKNHGSAPLLDKDKALMITGTIDLPDAGPVSACLFNGTHYEAYALTTSDGRSGSTIGRIFSMQPTYSRKKHMPLVFVVLIGLAISLALILLMVIGGIVLDRIRKRREGYVRAPTSMRDRGSGIQRVPPRELLESLGRVRPGGSPAV